MELQHKRTLPKQKRIISCSRREAGTKGQGLGKLGAGARGGPGAVWTLGSKTAASWQEKDRDNPENTDETKQRASRVDGWVGTRKVQLSN